jgi:hypothetical protein
VGDVLILHATTAQPRRLARCGHVRSRRLTGVTRPNPLTSADVVADDSVMRRRQAAENAVSAGRAQGVTLNEVLYCQR